MSTTFTKKLTDDKGRIYLRFDSIIIGAGAAGMMAAVTAARAGRKVAVFEKNDRTGKKLRITGKGINTLFDPCSAGIVNGNKRCLHLHCLIHSLADLHGLGFTK